MSVESDVQQFVEAFGERVKQIRVEKGLAQIDLAAKAEMKLRQIQRIEAGHIATSIGKAFLIARALEVPLAELVSSEPIDNRKDD